MVVLKATYNQNTDETKVAFSEQFTQLDYVAQIDCLEDAIFTLTKKLKILYKSNNSFVNKS
jgi:hypothetical protein